MRVNWVELDARHTLILTVTLFEEGSRNSVDCICLGSSRCIIVSKHLKVKLEDINDFVRLKCLFDTVCNSIDELIKFLVHFAVFQSVSLHFVDEITGLILHLGVNASIVVGLGLECLHLVCCLQANLKLLSVDRELLHSTLLDDS